MKVENDTAEKFHLMTCDSCGRKFNGETLIHHAQICEKLKMKSRNVFSSFAQRAKGILVPFSKLMKSEGNIMDDEDHGNTQIKDKTEIKQRKLKKEKDVSKKDGDPNIKIESNCRRSDDFIDDFHRQIFERDLKLSKYLYLQKQTKKSQKANGKKRSTRNKSDRTDFSTPSLRSGRSQDQYLSAKNEFVTNCLKSKIPKSTMWKSPSVHLKPISTTPTLDSPNNSEKSMGNCVNSDANKKQQTVTIDLPMESGFDSWTMGNYCVECGFKFTHKIAKFCSICGTRRSAQDNDRD